MPPPTSKPANELRLRIASAAVLLPVLIVCSWLGGWPFLALLLVAVTLLAWEWHRLTGGGWEEIAVQAVAGIVALLAVFVGEPTWALLAIGLALALVAIVAWLRGRLTSWTVAGLPYLILPGLALLSLRSSPDAGRALIFWLFVVVIFADTGAYFAGRAIGGPKLAPGISPGKTWSGFVGGVVAAVVMGAIAAHLFAIGPGLLLAAVAALLAVVAPLGDLTESWIKRRWQVKDSSGLIPGHGGILDRVDAVLFVAPIMWLTVRLGDGRFVW